MATDNMPKNISKKYNIDDFNQLLIDLPCRIEWVESDTPFVEITSSQEFLDAAKVSVKNKILSLSLNHMNNVVIGNSISIRGNNNIVRGDNNIVCSGSVIINNQVIDSTPKTINGNKIGNISNSVINSITQSSHTKHQKQIIDTLILSEIPQIIVGGNKLRKIEVSSASMVVLDKLSQDDLVVSSSSSSNMAISGKIGNLLLDISGSCDAKLDITSETVKIKSSGSSDIKLKGKTEKLVLKLSGSSEISAKKCITKKLKLNCSGASDVAATVAKKVDLDISGVADIDIYGNPKKVKKVIDGLGDVVFHK